MVTTGVPPWIGKPQMPQILRDVVRVKVVQIHQRLSKSGETVFWRKTEPQISQSSLNGALLVEKETVQKDIFSGGS